MAGCLAQRLGRVRAPYNRMEPVFIERSSRLVKPSERLGRREEGRRVTRGCQSTFWPATLAEPGLFHALSQAGGPRCVGGEEHRRG